jgi:mRNA-degrading endonuclease RelE of RelBE toxin-antitoxin system
LKNGETPGDRLQDIENYIAYKVRLPNRDMQRGKSGGYRVIYYVRTADRIFLMRIYTKSEQENDR